MSALSSGLLAAGLAEGSRPPDNLILHTLLAWWCAAVVRVLVRIFILGQAFQQLLDFFVFLTDLEILGVYVTVLFDNLGILLIDGFPHQPHLFRHVLQYFGYVRNLLFHRNKGTKNISNTQEKQAIYDSLL